MATRWNSVFYHIQSFLKKDVGELNKVLVAAGQNIQFSLREYQQLRELEELLQPFAEATNITQGEKVSK